MNVSSERGKEGWKDRGTISCALTLSETVPLLPLLHFNDSIDGAKDARTHGNRVRLDGLVALDIQVHHDNGDMWVD